MEPLWAVPLVVLWIGFLFQSVVVFGLARTIGLLQLQLGPMPGGLATDDSLAVGAAVPEVHGKLAPSGRDFDWAEPGREALLLFVTPTCPACRDALRDATRIASAGEYQTALIAISHGTPQQNNILGTAAKRLPLVSDDAGEVHAAFAINQTPLAMLVRDGRVAAKAICNNRDQLEALLDGQVHHTSDPLWQHVATTEVLARK